MEWRAFVLKAKTKPGILFTDNGDLFTIRLARSETLCIDHSAGSPGEVFAPCRGIRIPDSGKFSLVDWFRNPGNFAVESGISGLWIPEYSSGNPEYSFGLESGLQYLESGIHGMESKIQDCLGFHGAKVSRVSGFPWMDSSDTNILKLKLVQWDIW